MRSRIVAAAVVSVLTLAACMRASVPPAAVDTSADEAAIQVTGNSWFEGFKARSDLYSVVAGRFVGGNPALEQDIDVIDRDRYGAGWLYAVQGTPDPDARDADGYVKWLDEVIDRMRGKGR